MMAGGGPDGFAPKEAARKREEGTLRPLLPADMIATYAREGLWQEQTLWHLVERADRNRTAVICPRHGPIRYGELLREAETLAAQWYGAGISPGDPVVLQIPNWYDFVLAHLALTRLGAVTLPALPTYRERELDQMIGASGAVAVIGATTLRHAPEPEFYAGLLERNSTLRRVWLVDGVGGGLRKVGGGRNGKRLPPLPESDEITILIATSGTTGAPKLVAHSHRSTLGGVLGRIAAEIIGLTEADVILMASPVTHMTGLQYGVRMAAWLGATLVLMDRWEAGKAADLIAAHSVTYTQGATPFLYDVVHLPSEMRPKIKSLRAFGCGGAPIPTDLAEAALKTMPTTAVLPTWGLSETAIVTLVTPDDPAEKVTTTDGRAVPGWEVRVVSPESEELGPGEVGEIECRGAGMFYGYYKRPDLTEAAMDRGWLRTGDLGRLDAEGYVRCLDRIKDLIIRGGLNISPIEIEALMREHPAVRDVAVIGMPDARLGERICAVVVPTGSPPSLAEIGEYLKSRGLSPHKVPERIVPVASLPVTASGKVQKFVIRQRFVAGGT